MFRLVQRRSSAVLVSAWRAQPSSPPGLVVTCVPDSLLPKSRFLSTGLLTDRKNITFTPRDGVPDVDPVAGSPAVTEIDLTQFLVQEPSAAAAAAAEVIEKIGPLTATDIGLTWWCPTGRSSPVPLIHPHILFVSLQAACSRFSVFCTKCFPGGERLPSPLWSHVY